MGEPGPSSRVDTSDDDDPVVREIPIIHSKKLEETLYLFQFPFKRKKCTNEDKIKKCMFKPQNKEVALEMAINTASSNFDSGRAELVAHEVDGDLSTKKDKSKVFFENELVDKVFLKSNRCVKDGENYAVAAFNGQELHLTSIKDIFQLRPHFPYLDKGLKKKKDVLNNLDSDEEEAGPSTAQQVTVKFKQMDDPEKKSSHELSYHALQAKKNQEPWITCTWHEENSTASNVEKLKLISDNTFESGQAQSLSKMEYLKLLVPEDKEQKPLEPTLPSHVLSLHALRGLPLQEQCRLLLKDAQIIQFQQIMLLLAGGEGVTADALIKNLQKVAVLVRGNWVVKSEVLYPENTFSATSGVPAELMCRARDYILYLFTKQQLVERKKVSSLLKIPAEEVKDIFSGISKLTHNKGWELSLPTDSDFLTKHSDLAQRQNLFWEHRYHQLSRFLSQPAPRPRHKSKSASESDGGGGKQRTSSISCSDNESGTESKGKSPVLPRKRPRNDSCGSTSQIPNGTLPDPVAAPS
ncbi:DNA-directed RNA polymerase III subunit RPC5 [Anthonomus grandis grandis]|uniref:DNA-directed RNA polymerase III subunit RPC5 n=1 Tax=Anthonomus grandis grandis TaxID=2921223 RepID=UPI00216530B9|nr:DNA-directed RNA polymerase III subunit RPC5 [Anthonomus grandis grandis]